MFHHVKTVSLVSFDFYHFHFLHLKKKRSWKGKNKCSLRMLMLILTWLDFLLDLGRKFLFFFWFRDLLLDFKLDNERQYFNSIKEFKKHAAWRLSGTAQCWMFIWIQLSVSCIQTGGLFMNSTVSISNAAMVHSIIYHVTSRVPNSAQNCSIESKTWSQTQCVHSATTPQTHCTVHTHREE